MTTKTISQTVPWTLVDPCPVCSLPGVQGWFEDCHECDGEGDLEVDHDVTFYGILHDWHEPHPYGSTVAYEHLQEFELEDIEIDHGTASREELLARLAGGEDEYDRLEERAIEQAS